MRGIGSEGTVADLIRDNDEDKSGGDEAGIYLPCKLEPMTAIRPAQGELNQRSGGPEGVGKAVPVLVGQHHDLLVVFFIQQKAAKSGFLSLISLFFSFEECSLSES